MYRGSKPLRHWFEQVRGMQKILRSDETGFTYERDRQPMPRIGPWQQKLDAFLQGTRTSHLARGSL